MSKVEREEMLHAIAAKLDGLGDSPEPFVDSMLRGLVLKLKDY